MTQELIFDAIKEERKKLDEKWGEQNHSPMHWCPILTEEVGEVNKAALEAHFMPDKSGEKLLEYYNELVQTAAVCVSMLESLMRNEIKHINYEF